MLENAWKLLVRTLRARAGDHAAVEHDLHAACGVRARIAERVEQVRLGVGALAVDGTLRAGEHDGLGRALDQVRQRRRRIGHGVRAVQHDESVTGVVALPDGLRHGQPVRGRHVRAVDAAYLRRLHAAQPLRQAQAAQDIRRAQARRKPLAALARGDRAAGGDHADALSIPFHGSSRFPVCHPVSYHARGRGTTRPPPKHTAGAGGIG